MRNQAHAMNQSRRSATFQALRVVIARSYGPRFREVVERSKRRECKIMTSVLTLVEVLAAKLPVGTDRLFNDLMKRINRLGMDSKCASLAHDIRNHYATRASENGGKTLSTPDAIHLATAILHRADEFHTFDNDGSSKFSRFDSSVGAT
jgi:predicted nucleic acid-binding protein